jgi:acetyl esterase
MITPLDPVIAQLIPLLPLRDPNTMTPESARDALRALAAARADIPPPPVRSTDEMEVMGADVRPPARVYRLLAIETGAVVISVDYRRPPETRLPGAFEQKSAHRSLLGQWLAWH